MTPRTLGKKMPPGHFSVLLLFCAGLWLAGCSGGSSGNPTPTPTPNPKSRYEGPGFGDDETGGIAYTNTDILVRPPDQNEGRFGVINSQLTQTDRQGDGWYFDTYTFTAIESGNREIRLGSEAFDPVLAVFRVYPDGYWEFIELDDDDDVGTNARLILNADRNANYVVTVTTYRRGELGNYSLSFAPGLTYVTTRRSQDYPFARPRRD